MIAHVVIAYYADGPRVTRHASKLEARKVGLSLRGAGVVAFSYPADLAGRLGLVQS